MFVNINGKNIPQVSSNVSPLKEGFSYGYGVFETIKFEKNKIYFLKEHLQRLFDGCKKLNINPTFNEEQIIQHSKEIIKKNELDNGVLKITIAKNNQESDLIITVRKNTYTKEQYEKGFRLSFTEVKRNQDSLLVNIKSNNYIENLIARQKAIETGFDEVIFENTKNHICEGAISNIFFIKNSVVYTPAIECGLLPGIIRDKIISIGKGLKLIVRTGQYSKEDLLTSDEIFITNSLLEIMPVVQLENKKYDIKTNLITKMLIRELNEIKENY
ncbi:4-amino-4-deoxychorismate lyase [Natranaerovirga pectinivora]|uniref:4-amino-4-deoxychorismate lyase n=1 Tax=Natranaerovirga pectinivora TaxID=682400 RepID=A0A4R3MJ44_9FIRM|nr:aminotransferase class IV [Natranaerovirga pectinivora]TCT13969.1 4-amino-4-deoxychorismate lyase [Natranaerovirga pectinivora]